MGDEGHVVNFIAQKIGIQDVRRIKLKTAVDFTPKSE